MAVAAAAREAGGDAGPQPPGPDGGGDGGAPWNAPKTLKTGTILLLGVTTGSDPHAVYASLAQNGASLEAVSLAGGAPVVLAPTLNVQGGDTAVVSGGAVAFWTSVTAGLGTFNVWTKAAGVKSLAGAQSRVGIFAATEDGARIAYTNGVTNGQLSLGVSDAATPTTTAVLSAQTGINQNAATPQGQNPPVCRPVLRFTGKRLFIAYCTANNGNARITTVPDGANATAIRLDAAGGAGTVRPGFDADTGGTKLFAVSSDANATGRVITVAAADVQELEDQTGPGFVLPDGSAVIYRTATGLRRASANGMPNPTSLVDGAKAILGVTSDVSRVLYRTLDDAPTGGDLRTVGTAAGSMPSEIVGIGTARPLGFSGSNADVLYFTDIGQAGAKLKAKPAAGGAERELASGIVGAAPAPAGDSVITFANPTQPVPNVTVVEIAHVSAKGGAVTKLADAVPQGGLAFSGKKLVYTRFAEQGSGLYTLDLP